MYRLAFIIISFIGLLAYTLLREPEPTLDMNFTITDKAVKDKLQVNMILYTVRNAAEWYPFQKRLTIVKDGQLLTTHISEKNIVGYRTIILNPTKSLYYDNISDNTYYNIKQDLTLDYTFDNVSLDGYYFNNQTNKKLVSPIPTKLPTYDITNSKFRIYPLDQQRIDEINQMPFYDFDYLKKSGKLLPEDILRISKFTPEQKQELIKINEQKQMDTEEF